MWYWVTGNHCYYYSRWSWADASEKEDSPSKLVLKSSGQPTAGRQVPNSIRNRRILGYCEIHEWTIKQLCVGGGENEFRSGLWKGNPALPLSCFSLLTSTSGVSSWWKYTGSMEATFVSPMGQIAVWRPPEESCVRRKLCERKKWTLSRIMN